MVVSMARVIVYHTYYGCDTGCCGHIVEMDGEPANHYRDFQFTHPHGKSVQDFVRRLVTEKYGAEHCADIDWSACEVLDDL